MEYASGMNSQENVEKHLLQQITYLTRLIEKNKHSNPKELQLKKKNQNYKFQTTSLISNKRLLKPEIKLEIPTSSENKLQSSLLVKSSNLVKNCDLKSQLPHSKLPESCKTQNKNVVLLTHIKKKTPEISLKEISVTNSVNPSISAVKKCIHVNRKVLFKNSSESTNDKIAVDTNCVHINPAKLTVCKSNQNTQTENKSDDARKVIHINPKYKLVKLSNSSNVLKNDNETCNQVLGDKKLKIHFNKNFIKHPQKLHEPSHLNEINLSSFKLPQTKLNIIPVKDKPNLNIPICNQNEKCLTSAKSRSANASTLVNNINLLQLPVISNSGSSSSSSSSNSNSKNNNQKCSDVLSKPVVSQIKVNKTPLSSQNLLNCNSNSKYKFTRKNKLVQQKVQPVFKQNNFSLSTKLIKLSKTKLIRRELMSTNKIKNKVCKVNKCLKYTPEQTSNKYKINRTLLNSDKKFDKSQNSKLNKNVWISPLNQNKSNTKIDKDKTIYNSANASNKFKLKNSNSTKTNSLKSPLKLSSKNLNSQENLKTQNSVYPKGKYGVQKHRVLLRKRLSSSSSLISLSPTKLIRKSLTNATTNSKLCSKNLRKINNSGNTNTSLVPVINTNLKLLAQNKVSPSLRTARSLKTKYKFIRNANLNRSRFNWNSVIRKSQKINLKATVNRRSRTNSSINRRKSITISGIKYHLTKTKLRRKFSSEKLRRSDNKIFRNKGDSFHISSSGKSLKRINGPVSNRNLYLSLYYRNKCLQRSETNFARNKVIQAKQRSIALLTKKLRKNNEPCLIFNRFGRCSGKERGTCNRVHDRKRVAICKKFLLGACLKKDCLLSHDVGLSKMPTCRHYLAGICMREDCPYLHVKLNSSAPICIPFLQGYCSKAEKCKQRHIYVCPEFEEKGQCSKGKSCKYPHPKCKNLPKEDNSDNLVKSESSRVNMKDVVVSDVVGIEDSSSSRYYTAADCSTDNDKILIVKRKIDDVDEPDSVGNEWLRKRPRVGQLPGYIPLNFDD